MIDEFNISGARGVVYEGAFVSREGAVSKWMPRLCMLYIVRESVTDSRVRVKVSKSCKHDQDSKLQIRGIRGRSAIPNILLALSAQIGEVDECSIFPDDRALPGASTLVKSSAALLTLGSH